MRTILLDTHIFLWMHHEPEKLPAKIGTLPMIHRDPFDRLLIATCIVNGWTLATQDEQIPKYPVLTLT